VLERFKAIKHAIFNDVTIEEAVPTDLTFAGSGANIILTASNVNAHISYSVTVEVSDGTEISAKSFAVTVTNKTTGGRNTTWDSSKSTILAILFITR
jgi:chitinase